MIYLLTFHCFVYIKYHINQFGRLPKVKEIAPEFYDMPSYDSWTGVLYNYITDPEIGPYSRIKRGVPCERYEVIRMI